MARFVRRSCLCSILFSRVQEGLALVSVLVLDLVLTVRSWLGESALRVTRCPLLCELCFTCTNGPILCDEWRHDRSGTQRPSVGGDRLSPRALCPGPLLSSLRLFGRHDSTSPRQDHHHSRSHRHIRNTHHNYAIDTTPPNTAPSPSSPARPTSPPQ